MYQKQKAIYKILNIFLQKRGKSRLSALKVKTPSKDKALAHFDEFYGNIFNKMWPSIRLALLSPQKYIAIVNNFSDTERIISHLEGLGALSISKLLEVHDTKLKLNGTSNDVSQSSAEILSKKLDKFTEMKKQEELSSIYPRNETPPSFSEGEKNMSEERLIEPSYDKSAAALSEYIPASTLKGMETFVPESQYFSYYAESHQYQVNTIEQEFLEIPVHLKAYTFEMGNVEQFPSPKRGITGVLDYYVLNGGSMLPVLALDLTAGDTVLDMCSAPGGKGLICLQTLFPRSIVLNDVSLSRFGKIKKVMKQYFYDFEKREEKGEIIISHNDGRYIDLQNTFNKILVDVPCTIDRHSVTEDENNIFRNDRIKERLKIPEIQSELLINALKLVKVNGTVVYSTCSLSPVQNEGVVAFSLRKLSEQTNNEYVIIDLKKALAPLSIIYNFEKNIDLKCGHLVVPYLPLNFGPTYFCKIIRIK